MMELHPDFSDLLAEFARSGVRFVLLGGYAVGHYARPRATKDLDVLVSGTADNLERVAAALDAFGAPAQVIAAVKNLGPSEVAFMGVPPVRVDILRTADGIDTEAAGRPQDLADVALLEQVVSRGSR